MFYLKISTVLLVLSWIISLEQPFMKTRHTPPSWTLDIKWLIYTSPSKTELYTELANIIISNNFKFCLEINLFIIYSQHSLAMIWGSTKDMHNKKLGKSLYFVPDDEKHHRMCSCFSSLLLSQFHPLSNHIDPCRKQLSGVIHTENKEQRQEHVSISKKGRSNLIKEN